MKTYEATIRLTDGSRRDVTVQVEDKPIGHADDTFIARELIRAEYAGCIIISGPTQIAGSKYFDPINS